MSASLLDSCSFTHQFKINLAETKYVAIEHFVSSGDISAGGHLWRIICYPRGNRAEGKVDYLSIFLKVVGESEGVKAIFEACVMGRDGAPSSSHRERCVSVYTTKASWGWAKFVERSVLESLYVMDGSIIVMCGVKVVRDGDAPFSDIGRHLGLLLDSGDGSDVSFVVGGEEFAAHRAILAARSPVFKAQLLGSMADAKMASISLHDISPATFRAMLQFIYTDYLPEYDEEDNEEDGDGDGKLDEAIQDLLAAADRYALDHLKLLCARKLWDNVSISTVGATLACAETYNCLELKKKCINFFADEKNFKKAVLTDGFAELVHKFPGILAELREKVGA